MWLLLSLTASVLVAALAITDPEFTRQWYLNPGPNDRIHLNVQSVWKAGIMGKGVTVAVVDSGVNDDGPELKKQVSKHLQSNSWNNGINWQTFASRGHGTLAAAVVAAKQNNGNCGSGVAPEASIVDVALFGKSQPSNADMAKALNIDSAIDISSNSWGSFDGGASMEHMPGNVKYSMEQGANKGRGGKGVVYVWAAGNGGGNGDSCAYEAHINSRYTIGVTGITRDGQALTTGESCDGVLVTAPSRNHGDSERNNAIVTPKGTGRGCQFTFSATSAAAPMVSGVVALMLQTRSELSWRDVQYILAVTSSTCGIKKGEFTPNAAGLKYSPHFGFGVVNADAAVSKAQSWRPLGRSISCSAEKTVGVDAVSFYNWDFSCSGLKIVEHLIATITVTNKSYRGSITATLTSGRGTRSLILPGRIQDFLPLGLDQWKVKSMRFLGESFGGTWNVKFDGVDTNKPVTVKLEVFGSGSQPNDGSKQPCMPTGSNNNNVQPTNAPPPTGSCREISRTPCRMINGACAQLVLKDCGQGAGYGYDKCNTSEC